MSLSSRASAPNLLRAFDAVYLLNLPDRTDRLRESLRELDKLDAAARTLVEVVPGVRATEAHGFPSVGAYGCFQAHLGALRLAQSRGVASVLLLEDDLHLDRELYEEWPALGVAIATEPWDLLNIGFHPDFNHTATEDNATSPVLFATTEPLGLSHCYAVHSRALPSMIAYFETILTRQAGHPRGGPMHHDGALYHYRLEHPATIRLRPRRSLVGQRSSRSDIAETRWFDRVPLVGQTVARLRTVRNRFR